MYFKEKMDIFGGVTVKSTGLEPSQKEKDAFRKIMSESLDHWRSRNVKGVWVKVSITDSDIIPVLVENGFVFHHTQPDYLMMTKWLPNTPSTLPRYAHTVIGVGGLVIDEEGRVLLMRERRGYYLGWKFPGGASDPGETIFDTAAREVFEETGVQAVGKALLCFRQINVSQYENVGDLFFVCLMDVINPEIKPCPRETAACRWFTREELESLPENEFHEFHREILRRYDIWKKNGRRGCHLASCQFTSRKCKMYYID
ncbi:hydrolase, NUDIX family [Ancylostoma caninum]|uniref:Hydrolase, NUDIX family n=1 Tax=Ancylostoma caninum TaxID=29170 RepID=A0A368GW75_ANCCA|nr:hydrolase, NUDIX family [Ancylostoma caninum]